VFDSVTPRGIFSGSGESKGTMRKTNKSLSDRTSEMGHTLGFRSTGLNISRATPKIEQPKRMQFGTSHRTDFQRVTQSMKENQLKDPIPTLKSLVGQDVKVMRLRPLEKNKHLATSAFRYGNAPNSQNEMF